jgi:glycosyltransferase involved in cell wall biosynthesis
MPAKEVMPRKKLAILGPTPRGYSAIGKVIQQMHPSLADHFEIDYFFELGTTAHEFIRQDYLHYATNVYNATEFNADRYAEYDVVLYHIGNSEYHVNTIKNALYLPGYAIIHDTKLPEIFALANSSGLIANTRFKAEAELDKRSEAQNTAFLSTILDNQLGVIVHSEYARKAINEAIAKTGGSSDIDVRKLNLPTGLSVIGKVRQAGRLNVGMAGVIHEGKGLRLLEDLTNQEEFSNVNFSIFGVPVASKEVMDRIENNERIHIAINLTDREFQAEIAQLDVLVNYREEYRGETSLSTIEAMRMGVVSIVRNVGWYSELPDATVIKLDDSKDIPDILQKILDGTIDINELSKRAKSYIASNYSYEAYSAQLYDLITSGNQSQAKRVEYLKDGQVDKLLAALWGAA